MRKPFWPQPHLLFALLALIVASALGGCNGAKKVGLKGSGGPEVADTSGKTIPHDPMICIGAMDRRVPVLMYHDVMTERMAPPAGVWFDTTTKELETQFDWLSRHDITPISLDQLYAHLTTGADIPRDSVVLTFDDNGEGFYQNVVPLLHKYNFPAAMFVHTESPTMVKPGRPHMSWDQLRELTKDPLVTIGAHSVTHPNDMRELTTELATKEINQCKADLERELKAKIDYFAYPNGKFNNALQNLTKQAGFKMAFTIDNGLAEESPSLFAIHRYERQQLAKAWAARDKACLDAPAAIAQIPLSDGPVKVQVGVYDGLKIAFVEGGLPKTVIDKAGRQGVPDFVSQAGAAAGINGGFFAMAGLQSTSNVMIGPSMTSTDSKFISDPSLVIGGPLVQKLRNRPLIIWGPKSLAIFPYQPETMNNEAVFRDFMPDMTDMFLAGAWIVHDGMARSDDQLVAFASKDISDPRRRAFIGITAEGKMVIGASLQTCSTDRLGEAAAAAGVKEAVLLDSGFSTSLVYNGRIVVTGHTARNLPSRPVPHAVVLMGQLDLLGADAMLASAAEGAKSPEDIEGAIRAREMRRRAREEAAQRAAMEKELAASGGQENVGVTAPPDAGDQGPLSPDQPGQGAGSDPTSPNPAGPPQGTPLPSKPPEKKPDPKDPKDPNTKPPGKPPGGATQPR